MNTHQGFRMYEGSRGEQRISRRDPNDFCPRCGEYAPGTINAGWRATARYGAPLCWNELLERYAK